MALEFGKNPKSAGLGAIGIERTLQALLMKDSIDLAPAVQELKQILANKPPGSLGEWQSLSVFFLGAGLHKDLIELLLPEIGKNPLFPWAHFAEALRGALQKIPENLGQALIAGAKEKECVEILVKSKALDELDSSLKKKRADRKKRIMDQYEEQKQDWLGQLETIRSQGLDAEEEQMLARLLKSFPKDSGIVQLMQEFQSKKALRFLEEKSLQKKSTESPERPIALEPELEVAARVIQENMLAAWREAGAPLWLGRDFALQSLWTENVEAGLEFAPVDAFARLRHNAPGIWIRCELLLAARKFLELLNELSVWEGRSADNPDEVVGILYFRAQALYGLGQVIPAIELMETIVANHPGYRSAATLLGSWKRTGR